MATPTPSGPDPATQGVLEALNTLYYVQDPALKKKANEWLEEFQHSIHAWSICHSLLTAPDTKLEGRLFAGQTLRAKILYDFSQLPLEQLAPLRDSLLDVFAPLADPSAHPALTGSRAIIVQLCLALADLALQMPTWKDPCGFMIQRFGQSPATALALLQFLKYMPEEAMNPKVAISSEPGQGIVGAAPQILQLLTTYDQAQVDEKTRKNLRTALFDTLKSWIEAGELSASQIVNSPLFDSLFHALSDSDLSEFAIPALCAVIHETQELQDNVEVIQKIIARLIEIRPILDAMVEDEDNEQMFGLSQLYSEAGQTYKELIVQHPADLLPLVDAIYQCAAFEDIDVIPHTFPFWYELATVMGRQPTNPALQPILEIYAKLQTIMVRHIQFELDSDEQPAGDVDDFRAFRHRMGDTLKDCCHVLGSATCLKRSYDLLIKALSQPYLQWSEIEAPLFSMRSMGAEVDPNDDEIIPRIMETLPKLPNHPKIQYAAILVISRYTEWTDKHPENLAFQLQYVSAGFEMADDEVSAAAAQAMKFMCQDCSQHLVPFLPQLHAFVSTVGSKLDQSDMIEVCEAIGYVISGMPADEAARALQEFCEPLIQKVQIVATAQVEAQKEDLQRVADALEQLDAYLSVIQTLSPVPESCFPTAPAIYTILDTLISRYAKLYYLSERIGTVLRRGLAFFPARALDPLLEPLLARMTSAFAATHYATYLWIVGKMASKFADATGGAGSERPAALLSGAFEMVTREMEILLRDTQPIAIPDVMDDYAHCFMSCLTSLPTQIVTSSTLALAVHHTLASLGCPAPETMMISLDSLATLSQRLSHPQFQASIQPIFAQWSRQIIILLLTGITRDFPDDALDQVQEITAATIKCSQPAQVEAACTEAMEQLPTRIVPPEEKEAFLRGVQEHLSAPQGDRFKNALNSLVRAARRARDRGRATRAMNRR